MYKHVQNRSITYNNSQQISRWAAGGHPSQKYVKNRLLAVDAENFQDNL